jgi:hypothetical protein
METIEALEIIGAKNMADIVKGASTLNLLYFIRGLGIAACAVIFHSPWILFNTIR